ncbi:hypothetical protein MRB53_037631 [Persea americana]|nr:hypothetical protein MRB53_037631 [Persea americana]
MTPLISSSPSRNSLPMHTRHNDIPSRSTHQPRHRLSASTSSPNLHVSAHSNHSSAGDWSDESTASEPLTPATDPYNDDLLPEVQHAAEVDLTSGKSGKSRAELVTQDPEYLDQVISERGQSNTQLISNLRLNLPEFDLETDLSNLEPTPPITVSLERLDSSAQAHISTLDVHPPTFLQPHAPYDVFSAPIFLARELTKPGAQKRTFHFDLDVTDYPVEGDVDFKVGGAVGVCPSNEAELVDEVFDLLGIPKNIRDKPVVLKTQKGRWPTCWGDDKARSLVTTRRELLTWCSDIQSTAPTKKLLRLLAQHATSPTEAKILLFLTSSEGQNAFCDLRTGSPITLAQLLAAFPSSRPPLPALFSTLDQLMPRFYSLSNDPHVSSSREGISSRRLIEFAVTVHTSPHFSRTTRTGVGSGFLAVSRASSSPSKSPTIQAASTSASPCSAASWPTRSPREFGGATPDGPMMLIGAGVGMAPFRGFILNRLQNATCLSKIWLVQGVRDARVDELYSGELGKYERQIKRVVQSRVGPKRAAGPKRAVTEGHVSRTDVHAKADANGLTRVDSAASGADASTGADGQPVGEARYVQDEVRLQSAHVWEVVQHPHGRVFVCGSSKGMARALPMR